VADEQGNQLGDGFTWNDASTVPASINTWVDQE
jgi:hypothetical protein